MALTIFSQTHHIAASAPDTTPTVFRLNPPSFRLDIFVFDNPVLITFSSDGVYFGSPREFSPGVLASLDLLCSAFTIVNKTVASTGRVDVTAFYSPREIVGVPIEVPVRIGQ